MPTLDPNASVFPRGRFLAPILGGGFPERLHPLLRDTLEHHLRKLDPRNWPHTMGAVDVFLDNLGLLLVEQFPNLDTFDDYSRHLGAALKSYHEATKLIMGKRPWTGDYLLGEARQANAGEPRPILRLLGSDSNVFSVTGISGHAASFVMTDDSSMNVPWRHLLGNARPETISSDCAEIRPLGVPLPPGWALQVPDPRLLPPHEATPDLPLRVGLTNDDLELYGRSVRNQGAYGTCTAHAVAVGLDIALVRAGFEAELGEFSPAWIHWASGAPGQGWNEGRSVGSAIEVVRRRLPVPEILFKYPQLDGADRWDNHARRLASEEVVKMYGLPDVRQIDPKEIRTIKTLLAAGWVVVVSTSFPDSWRGPAMNHYGIPMVPLPGEARAKSAHAWLLVGYDHVDGNQQWKYQGRLYCLNSWGSRWPSHQILGPGIGSLPFSVLLTEGIECFALRFQPPS